MTSFFVDGLNKFKSLSVYPPSQISSFLPLISSLTHTTPSSHTGFFHLVAGDNNCRRN
ncbi:hypothetical protein PIB30_096457, partial [Stylosanthes scabra]|nr:hypothetical protein [Stylosanthes scabra]